MVFPRAFSSNLLNAPLFRDLRLWSVPIPVIALLFSVAPGDLWKFRRILWNTIYDTLLISPVPDSEQLPSKILPWREYAGFDHWTILFNLSPGLIIEAFCHRQIPTFQKSKECNQYEYAMHIMHLNMHNLRVHMLWEDIVWSNITKLNSKEHRYSLTLLLNLTAFLFVTTATVPSLQLWS